MTNDSIKRYTVSGDISYPVHEDPEGDYVTYDDHVAAIAHDRQQRGIEVPLHIIRNWPDGFADRLQHVLHDVESFIPNVKLLDLQGLLAEYGFTMKVYEADQQPAEPLSTQDCPEDDKWNCKYCKRANNCPVSGSTGAEPVKGEPSETEAVIEAVIDYGRACAGPITVTEHEMRLHDIRALLARYQRRTACPG